MKILLFGKNGQIGWELNRSLLPLGEVIALSREEADLLDPETLRTIVQKIQPDVVVNAAAYTDVERAESEPELAYRLNTVAPDVLADECQCLGALMVHYSTDYVFDGSVTEPYLEDYEPNPLSVYGRTKIEGEDSVRERCSRHLIIRSSWVYASRGNNFVRTMMRLMKTKDVLHVVADQFGTPTWSRYIADASVSMIRKVMSTDNNHAGDLLGTYHLSSEGSCTWYEFSLEIMENLQRNGILYTCDIQPVTSDEYKTEAERPRYSVLDNSKIRRQHQISQVPWRNALKLCLDEMRR